MNDISNDYNQINTRSLDETLGPVIVGGLKTFLEFIRTQKNDSNMEFGVPASFEVSNIDSIKIIHGRIDDGMLEKCWFEAVESMIYAFEDNEPVLPDGILEMKYCDEPDDGNKIEINIMNKELYKKHKYEYEIHHEKVTAGLELFSKHYRDLWW